MFLHACNGHTNFCLGYICTIPFFFKLFTTKYELLFVLKRGIQVLITIAAAGSNISSSSSSNRLGRLCSIARLLLLPLLALLTCKRLSAADQ